MVQLAWACLVQSCLLLLARARARPSRSPSSRDPAASCELHRKQSELNSFLWTIKRDPPSYFFGTIHVPYTRVWDFIPENSKKAFQHSHIVYFELDLTDPYTISALTSCQLLPQGENLQDVLPRDIYRRLKRHLEYVKLMMPSWMTPDQRGKGLYADYLFNAIAGNWERKRPVWVMLMVNSLTEVDIKSRGVPVLDLYLAQEAERLRKQTGAVEKVEEQCHPLNGLNFSQVIFALNQTLLQQESLRAGSLQTPYTTEDLIEHYNCGDLNSIIFSHDTSQVPNFINATLPPNERITAQEIDSYFRQELIYKRNERMGKRVKDLLEEYPDKSFFFAFGAGHFMGNNTVIDVLGKEGYEVEHTPAGQPINKRGHFSILLLLAECSFLILSGGASSCLHSYLWIAFKREESKNLVNLLVILTGVHPLCDRPGAAPPAASSERGRGASAPPAAARECRPAGESGQEIQEEEEEATEEAKAAAV
ncbi:metalloprotease TIKI1 isoform X2 [Trachemys scripta elegans]|uniref:metalloprotease TIKI1 isoform X2 n=1 Tax=Trachemys scripta elegans TaxID=31138 RepID=UPI001553159F|nr:metalloprotease TIKI1 isoform X2 [Trachemys scripta elegans]